MSDHTEAVSILSLFPQSPETLLTKRKMKLMMLKQLQFFLGEMLEAIDCFYIQEKLECFDPHVGDTLCQIRAYQLLLMILDYRKHKASQKIFVDREKEKICRLLVQTTKIIYEYQAKISENCWRFTVNLDEFQILKKFLSENNILFFISQDLFCIFQCWMLTKYSIRDSENMPVGLNSMELSKTLGIGRASQRILHCFQCNLSKISCDFVKKIISEVSSNHQDISGILHLLQMKDDCGRLVLPVYEVTKAILMHALSKKISIIFVIDHCSRKRQNTIHFLFSLNFFGTDFQLIRNASSADLKTPGLVVKGRTSGGSIQKLLDLGPLKTLLANMAAHPAYSATEFSSLLENPYQLLGGHCPKAKKLYLEWTKMRKIAAAYGCTQKDQRLFLNTYVFCDKMENQLKIYKGPLLLHQAVNDDYLCLPIGLHKFY